MGNSKEFVLKMNQLMREAGRYDLNITVLALENSDKPQGSAGMTFDVADKKNRENLSILITKTILEINLTEDVLQNLLNEIERNKKEQKTDGKFHRKCENCDGYGRLIVDPPADHDVCEKCGGAGSYEIHA